jgi:signal transduction histidine kinase
VSHEVRTPLSILSLGIDRLKQTGKKKEKEKLNTKIVEMVEKSGKDLLAVFNNILDLTIMNTDGINLTESRFDMRAITSVLDGWLNESVEKSNVKIRTDHQWDTDPLILGDPVQVKKMLKHIIENAIKFTSEGEISFTSRSKIKSKTSVVFEFSIKNTGPEIPEQVKTMVFQEFVQGDGTTTRKHGGLGVSLSIARHIAERMNGKIELFSTPQHNEFVVTIILKK